MTALQQFELDLLTNKKLNKKARVVLQMRLMSRKQPFTLGLEKQAGQLKLTPAEVRGGRRLALKTGLFINPDGAYERTPSDQAFSKRFQACKLIDLTVRLASKLLDMSAGSDDRWTHMSERQLARELSTHPVTISKHVKVLEEDLGLFEVDRSNGRKNAYRPILKEKVKASPEEIKKAIRQADGRAVDDIVAGLFNGSKVLAGTFKSDILVRARQLRMTDSDAELAAALGKLYHQIGEARAGRTGPNLKGPLEILRYYVNWLGEQHWLTVKTVALLQIDSGVFGQWRREQARYEVRDCDQVTGRDRW